MKNFYRSKIILLIALVSACTVGPNYLRPKIDVPVKYKEAPHGFKIATPNDATDRGSWWKVFADSELNSLEEKIVISNQNILSAEAQYRQARALVEEARAGLFPTLSVSASLMRQKSGNNSSSNNNTLLTENLNGTSTNSGIINSATSSSVTTTHSLGLDASWEFDIWGSVRRNIEAQTAGAQASAALLASTRLSAEASLAQYYFQLCNLDSDQQLLDYTVKQYKKALQMTKNRYAVGVSALADVVQARSQLETAQASAVNNKINRATTEHAIAVLIGKAPADVSIPFKLLDPKLPPIPLQIPSELLERRPDIAQAERLMAQANSQIGVAIAAYFPTLTLSATAGYMHSNYSDWFSFPNASWGIGPALAETIFDGGLRKATLSAARANYDSTVALYKQTVLAAFQNVEDNLISINQLQRETILQNKAAADANRALQFITNQYLAGTVDYTTVITAQNTAYSAEKTAIDISGLEMISAVGLIKALGGGWKDNLL